MCVLNTGMTSSGISSMTMSACVLASAISETRKLSRGAQRSSGIVPMITFARIAEAERCSDLVAVFDQRDRLIVERSGLRLHRGRCGTFGSSGRGAA
jgi:hypothetical protein